MQPIKDPLACHTQLAVVEKYEAIIAYLYPIAQNIPRSHGVAKAMFIECLLGQVKLFIKAGKSNQISQLFVADAGLAELRYWLRFLSGPLVRKMTSHQVEVAQVMIAEVGKMLGKWIATQKRKGKA